MKKRLSFMKKSLSVLIITGMMWAIVGKANAQTAYVSLDTLQSGDTIFYCISNYDTVILYKPTIASTNIRWDVQKPIYTYDHTADTLFLNTTNTGPIWFNSTETGLIALHFFLVGPPVSTLTDTIVCGNVFSITFNAKNEDIGATYLWSNDSITKNITVHQEGESSVIITNGCGITYDTALVTGNHANDANLGANQTICGGDSVILSTGNANIFSYHWSTDEITSTISVDTTGTYIIVTTDNNNCISADTVNITVTSPPIRQICYVSFDTLTWKNNINFPTNLTANIDSFNIYRQASLNIWSKIGSVSAGTIYFTDVNCNPQAQSYSYKIATVDTCGNEAVMSDPHTTITLLSAYDQGTDTYGFTWSEYIGLPVPDYHVYGIDANGAVALIGTVPGNQFFYNYVNPNDSIIKYFVGFNGPSCSGKETSLVKSNVIQSVITGIYKQDTEQIQFAIYPNPVTDILTIQTEKIKEVQLMDVMGRILLITDQKNINCSNLTSGVYFIKAITAKGMGIQKFVKQ
ncbi:MAG: T9SS type A sorting domain-containing protein [Candidatus Absconditabacterales bacterium]